MTLQLPADSDHVELQTSLYAVDEEGMTLPLSGNAPIPPGAVFKWQGPGSLGLQKLQYVATDNNGQHSICSFMIKV